MATRTIEEVVNDGGTDQRQALGRMNLGTWLKNLANPTVDASNRTVSSDIHEMADSSGNPQYGIVLHVHATAGGSTGPKAVVLTGTPGSGQVKIEYTDGRPKLTFAAGDTVSSCRCHWLEMPLARDSITTIPALLVSEAG